LSSNPRLEEVSTMAGTPVDRALVEQRIGEVNRIMDGHAGAIVLDDISDDGAVRVKFLAMCTACPFRPLTMAGTIRPALLAVPGVTRVEAVGSRISEEAEHRLAKALVGSLPIWPLAARPRAAEGPS
jgi:Fe-S cluster biogenesis protein NfuA